MNEMTEDVAVVGGGAAGLAAATRAKETGAERVLVLDRNSELGGILPQCVHTGFGLHHFKENLTGPEYITRFVDRARALGVESKLDTMVLRLRPGGEIVAANSPDGLFKIKAKSIVLAMGCRERTRGALGIPGERPAGVFTAGTAQRLMDIEGFMPGKRVVVLGSGDVGLIVARRFAVEGAKVEAVVEILPYPGGLARNIIQCLEDFDIPLLLSHTVTAVHGAERVSGVSVAGVDEKGNPIAGTERTIPCDTLVLSVGLIPENELSEEAGIVLDPLTGGPVVDQHMETSVPGIFACGNAVHVHDLVDHVTETGMTAGSSAAKFARGELETLRNRVRMRPGSGVRYVVPQIISGDRPVTVYLRVRNPVRNATIRAGDIAFPLRAARPAETVTLEFTERRIEKLIGKAELEVGMEEQKPVD
ncbi:MAG TPA: FAD-dependent oxidoreductase [Thermoproteota archaeon]|nr:FAD-dependent oxidoreductase [Thermoproteota archaeon]